ncbi:hypothetical protein [Nocardioides sp.]|uniref:hypothetical protein n=1 Tax=Nocardioides sp. TaxID=35761 RepID=UPI0039E51010
MTVIAPRLADLDVSLPTRDPFTADQARESGVSLQQLTRLTRSGVLRRLLHRVYVASDVPDSIELRCRAVSLALPQDAFVCDRTAAWVYVGSRALAPNEHLSVPPVSCFRASGRRALRGRLSVSGERAVVDADLREFNGLVLTTELRTALDLGRLQPTRDMRLWGLDSMLATGAFTLDELLLQVPRFKGERGVVLLRALAPLADPRSESFGESALRLRWYDAGLPRPQLQIPIEIDGVEVARLDMGLPEWLFAAEYDGERWHSDDDDVEHDQTRRGWLRTQRDWWIEVFRREHVFGRGQDADLRLRRAAHEARATFGARVFVI